MEGNMKISNVHAIEELGENRKESTNIKIEAKTFPELARSKVCVSDCKIIIRIQIKCLTPKYVRIEGKKEENKKYRKRIKIENEK
jgi:hypothetical protein